jgi:hypothetical protein
MFIAIPASIRAACDFVEAHPIAGVTILVETAALIALLVL